MKISLELPSGLRITFEGDESEFEQFTGFLADVPGFVESLGLPVGTRDEQGFDDGLEDEDTGGADPLAARSVEARFRKVGATTDIERVTVIAQLAVEAGREGVDYDTTDRLFEELGHPKSPRWSRTFFNAKERNLVRSVGRGLWRPTIHGENFARLGHRTDISPRRRGALPRAGSLPLEIEGGDES